MRLDDNGQTASYDDQIVRLFLTATVASAVAASAIALFLAVLLVLPGIGQNLPFLSFGRLRPMAANLAIFGFAGNAMFAGVYYSTQRLCNARIWSDALGRLHFWGWQFLLLAAVVTLPLGITQGREYAELEWPIDLLFAAVWIGCFGVNVVMTILRRREHKLYVSLWFHLAAIVGVAIAHTVGNLALPVGPLRSYPTFAGVRDAIVQTWHGQMVVAFFLGAPFLGSVYYLLPKASGEPLFSRRMAVLHFWSFALLAPWAGARQLQYTSAPEWISSLGMVFGLALWAPACAAALNGMLTLRGAWRTVSADPVIMFLTAALLLYAALALEASVLSIKSVAAITGFTEWGTGHVEAMTFGWCGLLAFAWIYWLVPRLFQADSLWSAKLARVHLWLAVAGLALWIVPTYIAGLTRGLMWHTTSGDGQLLFPDFLETVRGVLPHYWARVAGALFYLVGTVLAAVNVRQTWARRRRPYEESALSPASIASGDYSDPPRPRSRWEGDHSIADVAKRWDVFRTLWWHRKWERSTIPFALLTGAAVCAALLVHLIPSSRIDAGEGLPQEAEPLSPLELAGRDVYVAEGCSGCHTQQVRPLLAETKRYGRYSRAGEGAHDRPALWGTRRIGPDLAREGGKQSHHWHLLHLQDPRQIAPGSLMPGYAHLIGRQIDFGAIPAAVRTHATLGAQYDRLTMATAAEDAQAQARKIAQEIVQQGGPAGLETTEVVALIAYLQRLGVERTMDVGSTEDDGTWTAGAPGGEP